MYERPSIPESYSSEKTRERKKTIEETRTALTSSIEACKHVLQGGAIAYPINPSIADVIWQEIANIPPLTVLQVRVTLELPPSFIDCIKNHANVKFHPLGANEVFAGTTKGYKNGRGDAAKFNWPWGICLNPNDNCLYVADLGNGAIRRITMEGEVSSCFATDAPSAIAINIKENAFYIASNEHSTVTKIANGTRFLLAGNGKNGYTNGIGTNATFNSPMDITIDQLTGNIYVCDYGNHLIRKITPHGKVSTVAGSTQLGFADGRGTKAKFNCPRGIIFDEVDRSLLVCDRKNDKLRKVQLNGVVTTLCDIPSPRALVKVGNNTLLVSSYTNKLFKVTRENFEVETLVGQREDGRIEELTFDEPRGIAVDESSRVCYVTELEGNTIRRVWLGNIATNQ